MGGDAGDVDHAAVLLLAVLLHLLRDGLDHEAGPGHVNSDKFNIVTHHTLWSPHGHAPVLLGGVQVLGAEVSHTVYKVMDRAPGPHNLIQAARDLNTGLLLVDSVNLT